MKHLRSVTAAVAAGALTLGLSSLSPAQADSSDGPLGALDDTVGSTLGGLTSTLNSLLADSIPRWARGAHQAVPGGDKLTFVVQLPTRNQTQLDQFVKDVNDPSSPKYHHYLTPAQYAATYAPTSQNVAAVQSALTKLGLTVVNTTPHGSAMVVSGPVSAIGAAFGTSFGAFWHDGASLLAPLSSPTVPSSLRGLVANVDGLAQEFVQPASATPLGTPDGYTTGEPCSSYYGEKQATDQPSYEGGSAPYAPCGYTAKQLRSAYGLDATGLTGKGASIGIVDAWASSTALQDANQLATSHGEQPFADGQFVENIPVGLQQAPDLAGSPITGALGDITGKLKDAADTTIVPFLNGLPEQGEGLGGVIDEVLGLGSTAGGVVGQLFNPTGWVMEEELDIEAVHAMAPDAKVVYQGSVTPYPDLMYLSDLMLVEDGQVQAVSNSFTAGSDSPLPTDKALVDAIGTQAAATGVTLAYASGDSGDNSQTGTRQAQFPATDDKVLAVGGTTAQIGADGALDDETYWGSGQTNPTADGSAWDFGSYRFASGGGGGVSTSFAEPSYQQGVVPDDLATYGGVSAGRVVPDLSMNADPTTGMQVGTTMKWADGTTHYGEYRIGGTSLACPLMIGTLALAVEANGGRGLGEINPTLYSAASAPGGLSSVFNDPSAAPVDSATKTTTVGIMRTDHTVVDDPSSPSSIVSLITAGNLQTLHALPGYDDSTGLGSPKAGPLVQLLVPSWTPPAS